MQTRIEGCPQALLFRGATPLRSDAFTRPVGPRQSEAGNSMVRSWSVGASIGGAALAVTLLAGCGAGGDDAAASPSSTGSAGSSGTASATTEPSPGETPADYVPASLDGPAQNVPKPVLPELAKEESRDGAQAFLDYWSDAMWYAYQTGDTSHAREIISPACEVCIQELGEVEQAYKAGQWLTGGRQQLELQDFAITRAADGVYKPVVKYRNDEVQLIDASRIMDTVPPDPNFNEPIQVYMDYSDGSWVYITMAPLSGG
ncbi:DUF6318 family protein [Kocuria sp. M1R5S2]|uniref:DUF6318 family protein n=1 Tax=Kocuria rhizosphaerae TaxID=3376285 RepID=UPI0037B69A98